MRLAAMHMSGVRSSVLDTPSRAFDHPRVRNAITAASFLLMVCLLTGAAIGAQNAQVPAPAVPPGLPDWAYTPPPPPDAPRVPAALPDDDNAVIRIPGTERTM